MDDWCEFCVRVTRGAWNGCGDFSSYPSALSVYLVLGWYTGVIQASAVESVQGENVGIVWSDLGESTLHVSYCGFPSVLAAVHGGERTVRWWDSGREAVQAAAVKREQHPPVGLVLCHNSGRPRVSIENVGGGIVLL